jgi:hypothetical protein
LNHKSQQIDELEVFQKQAKILLSESDNKYNKMLRFYERKDNDVKEAIQREQTQWYEKRSIMQNKISNLQVNISDMTLCVKWWSFCLRISRRLSWKRSATEAKLLRKSGYRSKKSFSLKSLCYQHSQVQIIQPGRQVQTLLPLTSWS